MSQLKKLGINTVTRLLNEMKPYTFGSHPIIFKMKAM